MANGSIGVKGWRNYSSFSLFAAGSQRADRQSSMLVDTDSGNLSVLATDWVLAARVPGALTRAYNHLDSASGVDRPFGPGWYWQYDMNLTGNMAGGGDVTWKAGDGSEYEFTYSGGAWANDNKLTYQYDALERQNFEQRHDWQLGAWASKFDTTQEYDKNGNRTRYHRNIGLGGTTSYGRAEDLSYTFNAVNALTQVTDADDSTYLASFTSDNNNNITQVTERMGAGTPQNPYNYLYTYFEYDDLNRLEVHKDKRGNVPSAAVCVFPIETGSQLRRADIPSSIRRAVAGGTNAWVWSKRSRDNGKGTDYFRLVCS